MGSKKGVVGCDATWAIDPLHTWGQSRPGRGYHCQRHPYITNRRSPTMRSDIVPGGAFPDYELPDHTCTLRRLSELQGDDPLILTLARGHYCPKEHQQHLELAEFYPRVAVA